MAAPFENSTWSDQWDFKNDANPSATQQPPQQQRGKLADYNKKIKSAAITGVDKTKVVASAGAKKIKSGAVSSIRWIKDQCQKKPTK